MQENNTIIGNLLTPLNRRKFKRYVDKYNGDFATKKLSAWEQFIAILLGQITNCTSLREIINTVNFHQNEHYHLNIKNNIARSTLAKASERRDWRIFRDVFFDLLNNIDFVSCMECKEMIKIIDSSPIQLDLLNHPWAEKTQRIEGIKLHLVYDLTHSIPTYFEFSGARTNDIEEAKKLEIKPNTTYVMDRGYMDFNWWHEIDEKEAYFVTRLKRNNAIEEVSKIQVENKKVSSQLIKLKRKIFKDGRRNLYAGKVLRRVIVQRENRSPLILVTNDLKRSSSEIAELYKQRWQIELFFKWIKQNLKIKKFLGKSENAVKTQICIALIAYVLIYLCQKIKNFCKNISLKMVTTIIKNGLFTRIKFKPPKPPSSLAFKQLQFTFLD